MIYITQSLIKILFNMNLYYKIWVDCIHIMKNKEGNWKINSLIIMSLTTTLNFIFCMIVLMAIWKQWIGKEVLKLPKIDFLPFLMFVFLIFILSFLVHYFLIFFSKKYMSLLKVEERTSNGLLSKYFIISLLSLLFSYYIVKLLL